MNIRSEVSIAFTGDITFTKYFSSVVTKENFLDASVVEFIKTADHCIGNIEGAVTHIKEESTREFKHHSDARFASMISNIGIDIWNIANNHALDFGKQGVEDTYDNAERVGCRVVGMIPNQESVKPLIISNAGGIGVISVTYSEAAMKEHTECSYIDWTDYKTISKSIKDIKRTNRWCVIVAHGGAEFSDMPTPCQRNIFLKYVKMGADVVVGHHSHTVQNYEKIGGKTIFYSLGNFVFDTDYQRAQLHTETGELLKLHFTEESYDWTNLPFKINRDEQRISKDTDVEIFMNIDEKMYKKLWPYAAVGLSKSERLIVSYLNPEKYKEFNRFKWAARDAKSLKNKVRRVILFGKCIACVKNIMEDTTSKVVSYLSH